MSEGPIVFRPVYQRRVWGGRMLETRFGRALPDAEAPFGESWELVDRPEAQSVVVDGEFAGWSLGGLWRDRREQVFGNRSGNAGGDGRFPILMKILDAREKLSIQVHPPREVAGELGGEPKSEMWYVVAAEPGAELYVGLKRGVGRAGFEAGIREGATAGQVHTVPASEGDFIFIPSGRLHAIGAGLLIIEIQQNSDTTYRVFDWNRTGMDGKRREVQIEAALRSIDFDDIEPEIGETKGGECLVDCPEFRVDRWRLRAGEERNPTEPGEFAIFAVADGEVLCGGRRFGPGDFSLVPAGDGHAPGLIAKRDAVLIRTTL